MPWQRYFASAAGLAWIRSSTVTVGIPKRFLRNSVWVVLPLPAGPINRINAAYRRFVIEACAEQLCQHNSAANAAK
jgi:hypothetical protein